MPGFRFFVPGRQADDRSVMRVAADTGRRSLDFAQDVRPGAVIVNDPIRVIALPGQPSRVPVGPITS
jgi:hypothetical protein